MHCTEFELCVNKEQIVLCGLIMPPEMGKTQNFEGEEKIRGSSEPLILLVPGAGLEPAQDLTPEGF